MLSYQVAGSTELAALMPATLAAPPDRHLTLLVNADDPPDARTIIARCQAFACQALACPSRAAPGSTSPDAPDSLIITILTAPTMGLDHMAHHAANATLWAFTRQAALEWAPRGIRVNAIGLSLGTELAGPFEPAEQAGRATGPVPATAASLNDIAQTIRAIASWPSMTGQIIRLGV
jgi:NAD(P)-dependent dehydrogenase (short-subunit alcohol dehydrogenase family)